MAPAPCYCRAPLSPAICSLHQLLHPLWYGHARAPSHPHIMSLCLRSPTLVTSVPTSPSHFTSTSGTSVHVSSPALCNSCPCKPALPTLLVPARLVPLQAPAVMPSPSHSAAAMATKQKAQQDRSAGARGRNVEVALPVG